MKLPSGQYGFIEFLSTAGSFSTARDSSVVKAIELQTDFKTSDANELMNSIRPDEPEDGDLPALNEDEVNFIRTRIQDFLFYRHELRMIREQSFLYLFSIFEPYLYFVVRQSFHAGGLKKKRFLDFFKQFAIKAYDRDKNSKYLELLTEGKKILESLDDLPNALQVAALTLNADTKSAIFEKHYKIYIEARERRNLLTHRGRDLDKRYISSIKNALGKQGQQLSSVLLAAFKDNAEGNASIADLLNEQQSGNKAEFLTKLEREANSPHRSSGRKQDRHLTGGISMSPNEKYVDKICDTLLFLSSVLWLHSIIDLKRPEKTFALCFSPDFCLSLFRPHYFDNSCTSVWDDLFNYYITKFKAQLTEWDIFYFEYLKFLILAHAHRRGCIELTEFREQSAKFKKLLEPYGPSAEAFYESCIQDEYEIAFAKASLTGKLKNRLLNPVLIKPLWRSICGEARMRVPPVGTSGFEEESHTGQSKKE
jgi:hypothetical protein